MTARAPTRLALMVGVAALALAPGLAHAREAADTSPEAETVDEVIVTGIRASILKSQEIKRRADSVVDAITAEDIGKFTDQNVAEALQRVPGVQIQRDNGGEGTVISVRGLGPQLNRYTINGRTGFTGDARAFDYSTIPTELVAAAEVYKTPTADMDEGGLGAVVNVRTRRPLDGEAIGFATTIQGQYDDLAERAKPRISVFTGKRFADDTIGILLAGSYNENPIRQDYLQSFGWDRVTAAQFVNPAIARPGAFRQTTQSPTLSEQTRKRLALTAAVQWKPSDTFEVNADVLYSKLDDDSFRNMLTPQFQNTYPDTYAVYGGGITAVEVNANNTITFLEAQNLNLTLQNLILENTTETINAGVSGVWRGEAWTLSGDLALAKAKTRDLYGSAVFGGRFDVRYDARGPGVPVIQYFSANGADNTAINSGAPVSVNDPFQFGSQGLQGNLSLIDQSEWSAQVDAERRFDGGWLEKLRFGAKYRSAEFSRDYYLQNMFTAYAPAGAFTPFTLGAVPGVLRKFPVGNLLQDTSGNFPRSFVNFDLWQAMELFEPHPEVGDDFLGTLPSAPSGSYGVDEKILSGYARLDARSTLFGLPFKANLGVRIAYTDQSSQGFGPNSSGAFAPVSAKHSYTDVLPSANIRFDLTDGLALRLAAAKVITRAGFSSLSPGFIINDFNNRRATAGNPDLEPFRATQFDVTLEYYGPKSFSAVAGLFYKDIQSFITSTSTLENLPGQTAQFRVNRPVNGDGATVKGAEFAVNLPLALVSDRLKGFGGTASYTYVVSDATYVNGPTQLKRGLEGLSKHSYNLVGYYENERVSFQLAYNWRDEYVHQGVGAESNTEYATPQGYLSASATFNVSKSTAITLQGLNLTKGKFELYSDIPERSRFIAETGRSWIFGVRTRF